ncbi:Hexokinase [Artemisia annua]|uniref:Phosphotransferase n=1 Tax=Artemisia annua TaxID=35608 RepID=A0A2U1NQ06_ARTAN|nr:Hexokinase [Artemisia annua]
MKLGCGAEKLEVDVDFQAEGLDKDDAKVVSAARMEEHIKLERKTQRFLSVNAELALQKAVSNQHIFVANEASGIVSIRHLGCKVTIEVQKKPGCAFRAMFGNTSGKINLNAGAISLQGLKPLLQSLHNCLNNTDWATRKAAANALSALALHSSNLITGKYGPHIAVLEENYVQLIDGHRISSVVERNRVLQCLKAAIEKRSSEVIVSDFYDKDTVAAVVIGTGTNARYFEWPDALIKCQDLDAESQNPNDQGFEKMIPGMYFGDIVRRVIHRISLESDIFGPVSSKLSARFALRSRVVMDADVVTILICFLPAAKVPFKAYT